MDAKKRAPKEGPFRCSGVEMAGGRATHTATLPQPPPHRVEHVMEQFCPDPLDWL